MGWDEIKPARVPIFSFFRIAASVNNEALSRWGGMRLWLVERLEPQRQQQSGFFTATTQPVCQLLLDHSSASIVPGSVVLSKLRGDQSWMWGKKKRRSGGKEKCPLSQTCPPLTPEGRLVPTWKKKTNMDSAWLHKHSSKQKKNNKKNHWPCFEEPPYYFCLDCKCLRKEDQWVITPVGC